ncbi:hypothetical protein [Klebsiella aerogenes]|uniref:hypothetical protein n=1 Tax=Klebsiella aerogenes TaxID=548 RepID=UPI0014952838|nr:hypothetical protein [Klebsiella aerogenes]NPD97871.1 hypothetical protein [Klebsiella aerogenes]
MNSAFMPVTLSLDVYVAGEEAQAVVKELLRRTKGLSPRISEDEALRILLVDMTRDYLMIKSKAARAN